MPPIMCLASSRDSTLSQKRRCISAFDVRSDPSTRHVSSGRSVPLADEIWTQCVDGSNSTHATRAYQVGSMLTLPLRCGSKSSPLMTFLPEHFTETLAPLPASCLTAPGVTNGDFYKWVTGVDWALRHEYARPGRVEQVLGAQRRRWQIDSHTGGTVWFPKPWVVGGSSPSRGAIIFCRCRRQYPPNWPRRLCLSWRHLPLTSRRARCLVRTAPQSGRL